jgi:hypothetical protein
MTGSDAASTSTIDGVPVTSFTVSNNFGAIVVPLSANAMFDVSFNRITEDEALTLARKLDWKAGAGKVGRGLAGSVGRNRFIAPLGEAEICSVHAPIMQRFGYLRPDCGRSVAVEEARPMAPAT